MRFSIAVLRPGYAPCASRVTPKLRERAVRERAAAEAIPLLVREAHPRSRACGSPVHLPFAGLRRDIATPRE